MSSKDGYYSFLRQLRKPAAKDCDGANRLIHFFMSTWDADLALEAIVLAEDPVAAAHLAVEARCQPAVVKDAATTWLKRREPLLSGAEAVALLLWREGVRTVVGYAGTSELALCDAATRIPGTRFVNGRGDRESAFMAAGACLFAPCRAAAILHGARGLTNALGAIADVRRNEIGVVNVVGLPSTGSARFLPPHGEPDLVESASRFAKSAVEVGAPRCEGGLPQATAHDFILAVQRTVSTARELPCGPTLLGVPQDILETRWVPWDIVIGAKCVRSQRPLPSFDEAIRVLRESQRPLVLVDDYLLKAPGSTEALDEFSHRLRAPVLQVRYRRGPMLFARLSRNQVRSFAGWYEPTDPEHRSLMGETDLLITVEDRNLYPRVVGELPSCRKLVITSVAAMAIKNGYLRDADVVLEGPVHAILERLGQELSSASIRPTSVHTCDSKNTTPPTASYVAQAMRDDFADCLTAALREADRPVLIDDSQMLGGLLAAVFDRLPEHLGIVGDHGGFVGAGISYATGLALADDGVTVMCCLGDQGLTNGMQGLVAAGEQRAAVVYLVCNNGESVSLRKQAHAIAARTASSEDSWLRNATSLDYVALARAAGVEAYSLDWPLSRRARQDVQPEFSRLLREGLRGRKPLLIELRMPSLGEAWEGIWNIRGLE